jgi:hypothetical protein
MVHLFVGIHPKIVVEEGLQFFHEKFATIWSQSLNYERVIKVAEKLFPISYQEQFSISPRSQPLT